MKNKRILRLDFLRSTANNQLNTPVSLPSGSGSESRNKVDRFIGFVVYSNRLKELMRHVKLLLQY